LAEFEIKDAIAAHFKCDYQAVVFCGSAHLGFSPVKDTDFCPGSSDLDVAIIDMALFQNNWIELVDMTLAFTDMTPFGAMPEGGVRAARVQEMLARRGLLHLKDMPRRRPFSDDLNFLRQLSRKFSRLFSSINVSFYMNEYAFCVKQDTAMQNTIGVR
jgi:hypothetical protein